MTDVSVHQANYQPSLLSMNTGLQYKFYSVRKISYIITHLQKWNQIISFHSINLAYDFIQSMYLRVFKF